MNLKQRTDAFAETGRFIQRHYKREQLPEESALHKGLEELITEAGIRNNWFIPNFVNEAIRNIGGMLEEEKLRAFASVIRDGDQKTVALICAGNIPMVGFHDLMCVLLSGHKALIKLSSDDNVLLPFFLKLLVHYEPGFDQRITFAAGKLSGFDALIATGSDNTSTHLHYYFGKYPHIIRKSRTSVAVINGNESADELRELGNDVFLYFGLGCRNVSKLMVPEKYEFREFFHAIVDWGYLINNKKYGNNYDYNRAIYLLEQVDFLDNNFLMIRKSEELFSPVAVLYYQHYNTADELRSYLDTSKKSLQCVAGNDYTPFGYSQRPVITDFADHVNTLDFLVNL